jgi:AraC-like DNA-binding protein
MLLADAWRPVSISFGFEKPGAANFEQLLGVPVYFGAEQDSYCFPAADLHKPLPNSDEELLHFLREQAEGLQQRFQFGENIVSVVRQLIQQSLPSGNASLQLIAEFLAMHPRALQRKLLGEGTTFKRLLLETRLGTAQMLLAQSPMPLTQIADLLGYSELSAFSRAFKAEHGVSPDQWRYAAISRKGPQELEKPAGSR